ALLESGPALSLFAHRLARRPHTLFGSVEGGSSFGFRLSLINHAGPCNSLPPFYKARSKEAHGASTIVFQEVHTKILRFRSISHSAQNGQSASAVSRLQRLAHDHSGSTPMQPKRIDSRRKLSPSLRGGTFRSHDQ